MYRPAGMPAFGGHYTNAPAFIQPKHQRRRFAGDTIRAKRTYQAEPFCAIVPSAVSTLRLHNSKTLIVLLALLAVCAGCPVTQTPPPGDVLKHREPQIGAKYYLYVPTDHADLGPMPMVVTLHGTYGFDSAKAQVKEWGALAEEHGFVVVAPKLKSVQGILPVLRAARRKDLEADEKVILAAIEDVKRNRGYRINDKAVMITGFSAGGYPLYYVALRNPDVFSVMIARACNFDLKTIESIELGDKHREMPMLIFFSKTGINPVSSNLNPVARQSWAAYQHLRLNRCFKAKIKSIRGGHHRRPDLALEFWLKHQGAEFPRREDE